mmetsp:Transcript_45103/g.72092  ORF Transcript_45103/g.72092 Transcript_45103/m.72092 type:complete len:1517 (+) Transcript_45103:1288-5838(+)
MQFSGDSQRRRSYFEVNRPKVSMLKKFKRMTMSDRSLRKDKDNSGGEFQELVVRKKSKPENGVQVAKTLDGWQQRLMHNGEVFYFHIQSGRVTWEKPEAFKTDEEKELEACEFVWIPHPKHVWQPALVKSREKTGAVHVATLDTKEEFVIPHIRVMKGKLTGGVSQKVPLWPLKPTALDVSEEDLVALPHLDEAMVLHNLRVRYENDNIYTWVGSSRTVLISVNPFKELDLYDEDAMDMQYQEGLSRNGAPPHVFAIVNDALDALYHENKSQSILVSGESGAGKTHATKSCLDFLAYVAGSSGGGDSESDRFDMMLAASSGMNTDQKVEHKVLIANPVLEAFGNAKTVRNNNSSRFGKWIAVYIDKHSKEICGAQITSFLLESTRVCVQSATERNYHIFYQILSDEDAIEKYMLEGGVDSFNYINKSGCSEIDGVDDNEEFEFVVQALADLDFEEEEQEWLFRTTCAVLHLGNVEFESNEDKKGCRLKVEEDGTSKAREALRNAASLLEIAGDKLEQVLTVRSITVRGEESIIPLKRSQATTARDSLAKAIYGRLFNWLVTRVNESFGQVAGKFVGFLDIFGFEIFEHNSFEQLCINYANETLQQLFNKNTFGDEQDLYELENINFQRVEYCDNKPVLELIDCKPNGILNLLDDECVVPSGSDERLLRRVEGVHKGHPAFKSLSGNSSGRGKSSGKIEFSIKHFAGTVQYDMIGFKAKNIDNLFQDLYDICSQSTDSLTQYLFPALEDDERVKIVSQSAKFRAQLQELVVILEKTQSRYIRCIKPNDGQVEDDFDGRKSLEQLRSSGVLEAVDIRKNGFPYRLLHREFVNRYRCINLNYRYRTDESRDGFERDMCKEILDASPQKFAGVQIGEMRIMYRSTDHRMLELLRNLAMFAIYPRIERLLRKAVGYRFRTNMAEVESQLREAIENEEPDAGQLETAIEDYPETLGSIRAIFDVEPPSLAEAKRVLAGVLEFEKIEEIMEDIVEVENDDFDKELAQKAIDDADQLRAKKIPMTSDQKELYDRVKELLVDGTIDDLDTKLEEALETMDVQKVLEVREEAQEWTQKTEKIELIETAAARFDELAGNIDRGIDLVDRLLLESVVSEAKEMNYTSDRLDEAKRLLQLDEYEFLKLELECAKKWKDRKRQRHRRLRLREFELAMNFSKYHDFFSNHRFASEVSAGSCSTVVKKRLSGSHSTPRDAYGNFDKLDGPLLFIRGKTHIKSALKCFKNLRAYMGDSEICTQKRNLAGFQVVSQGLDIPEIRDEIYAQIINQVTGNSDPDSVLCGVDLLCLCGAAFPPSNESFENYVVTWVKTHLPLVFYNTFNSAVHDHRLERDQDAHHERIQNLPQKPMGKGLIATNSDGEQFEEESDDELSNAVIHSEPKTRTEGMKAFLALQALRDRFNEFKSGSRFSMKNPRESDPWVVSIPDFKEKIDFIVPSKLQIYELHGVVVKEEDCPNESAKRNSNKLYRKTKSIERAGRTKMKRALAKFNSRIGRPGNGQPTNEDAQTNSD